MTKISDLHVLGDMAPDAASEMPVETAGIPTVAERRDPASLEAFAGQGSLKLPTELLADPEGMVTGYFKVTYGEMPQEAHFLPKGVTAEVRAGQAVTVMTAHNDVHGAPMWETFQFPAGGQMEGPVVWGWGDAEDTRKMFIEATFRDREKRAVQWGASIGLSAAMCNLAAAWTSIDPVVSASTPRLDELFVLWALAGSACIGLLGFFFSGIVASSVMEGRAKTDVGAFRRWASQKKRVRLSKRLQDMSDYILGASQDATPSVHQGSIDIEVAKALADYRPLWREAQAHRDEIDRATFKMLEHSAGLIGAIASRISSTPQLLRNDDIRTSFRSLIERARVDVETALKRQVIAIEASVLGDIKALLRQLDQHGTT
jgi:hypothetical protein